MNLKRAALCMLAAACGCGDGRQITNSLGMRLARIPAGSFIMGETVSPIPEELTAPLTYDSRASLQQRFPFGDPAKFRVQIGHVESGDFDEKPARRVRIRNSFFLGIHEVTNAQYEQFDPSHRALRGKNGFSKEDDEAAVFVSWHEAAAFCEWLSRKEGRPYRLPTEAEWEYACRAGTRTLYSTGNALPPEFHKKPRNSAFDEPADIVPLKVGQTPPNPWGLFDMHGNVEEWCQDWYGPYEAADRTDPVGRAYGDFKVIRGGSHGTPLYYLRSANRMGLPPEARSWLTGFRVAAGEMPSTRPLPPVGPPPAQRSVSQQAAPPPPGGAARPYFRGPRRFVRIPEGSNGPLYSFHNHDTAITECPNGDLLAIWYTCVQERGRELAVAASRLRCGADEWEPASPFWDAPDRNDHCPALWHDGKGTLYHFNGLGVAGRWAPAAILLRTSSDNGATWSKARLIEPEFGFRTMLGEPVFRTKQGVIVLGADIGARSGDKGPRGSTVWLSRDEGKTWSDAGGFILGVHAAVAELKDGRLIAFGRGENVNGWMPVSFSSDLGKSWTVKASPFPPITSGQRAALLRLREGPLVFCSFARDVARLGTRQPASRHFASLFAAVSFDEGKSWPVWRALREDKPDHGVLTMDGARVRAGPNAAEPLGYVSICQGHDGLIHVLSSVNHYAFNLEWLKQGQPKAPWEPQPQALPSRPDLPSTAQPAQISTPAGPRFTTERSNGLARLDQARGFTIELRAQAAAGAGKPGLVFEVYAAGSPRIVSRYRLTVTPETVYYDYDGASRVVAGKLDNAGAPHAFRLAAREDTAAQIYRDNVLLGVLPADVLTSTAQAARGSYVEWGGTGGRVDRVSYDLSGPYAP